MLGTSEDLGSPNRRDGFKVDFSGLVMPLECFLSLLFCCFSCVLCLFSGFCVCLVVFSFFWWLSNGSKPNRYLLPFWR